LHLSYYPEPRVGVVRRAVDLKASRGGAARLVRHFAHNTA
jgi:hypothetical protein